MAFVRLLRDLMRDKGIGNRVVPIVPDEARTFGMDSFFPTAKIYNPHGQQYTAVDRELFLAYKESPKGQILHTGINEAGSMAAFTAAGTSYATHGEPMIPVYVFYSMFGFQRTGDQMWAAMDQMARGFIIGATAGRTTLTGEGLQHADGHSPILAAQNPAMKVYDPAYGYEIAHIVRAGLEQMYGDGDRRPQRHVLPDRLQRAHAAAGRARGRRRRRHRPGSAPDRAATPATARRCSCWLPGSPCPGRWRRPTSWRATGGCSADVWSVTSWTELRRDALAAEEHNFLHPEEEARVPYVTQKLAGAEGPIVASTDYVSEVPDQIRQYLPNPFATLGADGHGFSDTRPAARRFFHIDTRRWWSGRCRCWPRTGQVDAGLGAGGGGAGISCSTSTPAPPATPAASPEPSTNGPLRSDQRGGQFVNALGRGGA